MDYSKAFAISAAGMTAERMRVDVAALNLANANTLAPADGSGYQPMRVWIHTVGVPGGDFATAIENGLGLPQADMVATGAAPRVVHEPANPFADARGNVSYPAVDTATEMVGMMQAMRSYEANVAAMNMAKTLALRALNIGDAA
jgi:flagellar basal-body rod protein FlgC